MTAHKIWKQTIECSIEDKDRAWEVQNRLSTVFATQVVPVLDRHLNQLSKEKAPIIIDTLECDIGEIRYDTLESDLVNAIEDLLPKTLARVMEQENTTDVSKNTAQPVQTDFSATRQAPVVLSESIPSSVLSVFMTYLKTGAIAWNFGEPDFKNFIQQCEAALDTITQEDKQKLAHLFLHPQTRTRMIEQFPLQFSRRVLTLIRPDAAACLPLADQLIEDIKESGKELMPPGKTDTFVYSVLLDLLLDAQQISPKSFAMHFSKALERTVSPDKLIPLQIFADNFFSSKNTPPDRQPESGLTNTGKTGADKTGTNKTGASLTPLDHDELTSLPKAQVVVPDEPDLFLDQGYSISNAGMVTVATFLVPYFESLGLLDANQQFASDHKQTTAILALHILSKGAVFPAEYMCVLNKLLCGMPIQMPCLFDQTTCDLAVIEKEAKKLLTAVIGHWKTIKNTSASGIRQSFLNRDGILREQKNGWVLTIEKKGYDVLLESLPWSFSLIKTPWMKKPMEVQW